jgi:uncharacterized protein YlxP (DUF503 family)
MHVCAVEIQIHIPQATSLKAKRSVLSSLIETLSHRYPVAVAEVDHQDTWQRSSVAVASVSSSAKLVEQILDDVERYVWSIPDLEVISMTRTWLEQP